MGRRFQIIVLNRNLDLNLVILFQRIPDILGWVNSSPATTGAWWEIGLPRVLWENRGIPLQAASVLLQHWDLWTSHTLLGYRGKVRKSMSFEDVHVSCRLMRLVWNVWRNSVSVSKPDKLATYSGKTDKLATFPGKHRLQFNFHSFCLPSPTKEVRIIISDQPNVLFYQ